MNTTRPPRHPSTSSVTSKGQVTIPAHIRRLLGVKPGDRVEFRVRAGQVEIAPAQSVVERTKGMFKTDMPRMTPEEERAWFEQAVADEVIESMNRGR